MEPIHGHPIPREVSVRHGAVGYDYGVLFGDYISNARSIRVRDPYIMNYFQIQNMKRFLYIVQTRKQDRSVVEVRLETKQAYSDNWNPNVLQRNIINQQRDLNGLTTDFITKGVRFHWEYDESIHDRHVIVDEIRWKIKLGRGLDIYQQPTKEQQDQLRNREITYRDIPCREFTVTYENDF